MIPSGWSADLWEQQRFTCISALHALQQKASHLGSAAALSVSV